jgi:hypothetical protein
MTLFFTKARNWTIETLNPATSNTSTLRPVSLFSLSPSWSLDFTFYNFKFVFLTSRMCPLYPANLTILYVIARIILGEEFTLLVVFI